MFILRTLGELSVRDVEGEVLAEAAKPLLILAVLSQSPRYSASREHLERLLWPGSDEKRRKGSLRQALFHLNSHDFGSILSTDSSRIQLRENLLDVDVWSFDRAIENGRFRDALALHRGRFLEGMDAKMGRPLREWAEAERARIGSGLATSFQAVVGEAFAAEKWDEAIQLAERYVETAPLSDRANLLLFEAHHATGRDVEALQVAERYRVALQQATGEDPGPAFKRRIRTVEGETVDDTVSGERSAEPPGSHAGAPEPPVDATRHDHAGAGGEGHPPPDVDEPPRTADPGGRELKRRVSATIGTFLGRRELSAALLLCVVVAMLIPIAIQSEDDVQLELPYTVHAEHGILRVTPDEVEFRPGASTTDGYPVLPSPDGSRSAYMVRTPAGSDVVLDERGRTRLLTDSTSDERILDWAPDGRHLLYSRGWWDPEAMRYRLVAGLAAFGSEVDRREVELPGFDGSAEGSWAPTGTRIALTSGPRLVVTDGAGTIMDSLSIPGETISRPAWSPAGRRLAVVATQGVARDVWEVDLEGFELTRMVHTPGSETGIHWVGTRHLLASSVIAGQTQLLLVDADDGSVAVLSDDIPEGSLRSEPPSEASRDEEQLDRLARRFGPARMTSRVDSIQIVGADGPVSPGEYVVLRALPLDRAGEPVPGIQLPLEWQVESPGATMVGPGLVRAGAGSELVVHAAYEGWRSTRRRFPVASLNERAVEPAFSEDWSEGLDRWRPFGEPKPVLHRGDGPGGGFALDPNGDTDYGSGVIGRRTFATTNGLTVEAMISAPIDGRHFQGWRLALTAPVPELEPADSTWSPRPFAAVTLFGEQEAFSLSGGAPGFAIPVPENHRSWVRYGLQLSPDGELFFLVNGQVYHRGRVEAPDSAQVVIEGNSVGTEIRVGRVNVWQGERFGFRGSD